MKGQSVYNPLNTGPASSANVVINTLLYKDFDDLAKIGRRGRDSGASSISLNPHNRTARQVPLLSPRDKMLIETGVRSLVQGRHWSQHPRTGLHGFKASGLSCTKMCSLATHSWAFSSGRRRVAQWILKTMEMCGSLPMCMNHKKEPEYEIHLRTK